LSSFTKLKLKGNGAMGHFQMQFPKVVSMKEAAFTVPTQFVTFADDF